MEEIVNNPENIVENSVTAEEPKLNMTENDRQYIRRYYAAHPHENATPEIMAVLAELIAKRTQYAEDRGLRAFYTSDTLAAQSYADLMTKAADLRRRTGAYTPRELSGVLTAVLRRSGKLPSVPAMASGDDAYIRLFAAGVTQTHTLTLGKTPLLISSEQPKSQLNRPNNNDSLLLLSPGKMPLAQFVEQLKKVEDLLSCPVKAVGTKGLLDILSHEEGVYLVDEYLPGYSRPKDLCGYTGSLLVYAPQEKALLLRDRAAAQGLSASVIGKLTESHSVILKQNGASPLSWPIALLRGLFPLLPEDAEVPGLCVAQDGTAPLIRAGIDYPIAGGDCGLFSAGAAYTPYLAIAGKFTVGGSGVTVKDQDEPAFFRTAFMTALHAIARTVAAGADYTELTLAPSLTLASDASETLSASRMVSALLGLYRVQAEFGLPSAEMNFAHNGESGQTRLDVFCATPYSAQKPQSTFTAAGHNVYLLMPKHTATSPVDFEDTRQLFRYVNAICRDGVALSVAAVGEDDVLSTLRGMCTSGYGVLTSASLPDCPFGFLVESDKPLQGILLGMTTSRTEGTLSIGEWREPVRDLSLPVVKAEDIPMSLVGTSHPRLCLALTPEMGNPVPACRFAEQNAVGILPVLLNDLSARHQITALANAMATADIAVIAVKQEEWETLCQNKRVAYARRKLLDRGGLILCLITDRAPGANVPLPADHPFFFGTPAQLTENAAVTLHENGAEVRMCKESPAVARMLTCALAYFR